LFYAVRSKKTAAATALLEGGANLEAPGRWNGKRLPHARNTTSPENRNVVGVGLADMYLYGPSKGQVKLGRYTNSWPLPKDHRKPTVFIYIYKFIYWLKTTTYTKK